MLCCYSNTQNIAIKLYKLASYILTLYVLLDINQNISNPYLTIGDWYIQEMPALIDVELYFLKCLT